MGAFKSKFVSSADSHSNVSNSDGGQKMVVHKAIDKEGILKENTLKKVAGPPPPPPAPAPPPKKCSEQHACQMEDIEVENLNKCKGMDEEITKKYNLTKETFEQYWASIQENAYLLDILDSPTFEKERAKVKEAFLGRSEEKRLESSENYKNAVDEYLQKTATKNSSISAQDKLSYRKSEFLY